MSRSFQGSFSREVTVDDDGISVHRRDTPPVLIRWEQIERLSRLELRNASGVKTRLWLSSKQRTEFFKCASEEWRRRFPDRWLRDFKRRTRKTNWAAYFWIPLGFLSTFVAFHLHFWYLGSPDYLRWEVRRMDRLEIFAVIYLIFGISWYSWRMRKANRRIMNEIRDQGVAGSDMGKK